MNSELLIHNTLAALKSGHPVEITHHGSEHIVTMTSQGAIINAQGSLITYLDFFRDIFLMAQ